MGFYAIDALQTSPARRAKSAYRRFSGIRSGRRFYDPKSGRWISKDPIEERGGINLYGAMGNDGINNNDFIGLWYSGGHEDLTMGICMSLIKRSCCCEKITRENKTTDGPEGWIEMVVDQVKWFVTGAGSDAKKHYMVAGSIISSGAGEPDSATRKEAQVEWGEFVVESQVTAQQNYKDMKWDEGHKNFGQSLHAIQDRWAHQNEKGMPISDQEHRAGIIGQVFTAGLLTVGDYDNESHHTEDYATAAAKTQVAFEAMKEHLTCCE